MRRIPIKKRPRRNSCNGGSLSAMKKKKLIDNRLLAISIVVEDYIFENKPITRYEAEQYAKEVASYADKCLGDERSLQVIEKLGRHMKSIIAEQGPPDDEDVFTQSLPSTTQVYSVLDDMTQTTQNTELISGTTPMYSVLENDMTPYTQYTEVHDLTQEFDTLNCVETPPKNGRNNKTAAVKRRLRSNSELDEGLTKCTKDTEVEELTQGFYNLRSLETPNKKARKKRNARKAYSLDDDMTQYTQDSDVDDNVQQRNSQNKLNVKARNKRNTMKRRSTPKSDISENYKSDLEIIDLCDDDIDNAKVCLNVENTTSNTVSSHNILNNEIPNLTACSPSILASSNTVTAIPKSKDVSVKPDENIKDTENAVKPVDKSTKKVINKNMELNMDLTNTNMTENDNILLQTQENSIENMNYKKNIKAINQKINTQVNTINKLRNFRNISNIQEKAVNSVQLSSQKMDKEPKSNSKVNKGKRDKVIQNLSWLDNIRYVREIAIEEYEDILVPENFWNNYTLPGSWNPEDFSYS